MGEAGVPGRLLALTLLIEAYVDSLATARAAIESGADRLELCGPGEGGLTPSTELLAPVLAESSVPVHVMIRPREGGFVYSLDELGAMRRAVTSARDAGAAGAVFGVLRADGTLDTEAMAALIALARPLRVACHRAFDATPDADAALDTLHALGVDLVLTSGHAQTALEGKDTIARHVRRAREQGDRLTILAGGQVRAANVAELVAASGVREVHARATDPAIFAALVRAVRAARGD